VVISGIELFSVLAFVATVVFLVRRNLLPIARFRKPELNGFPRRDANIILLAEIVLIVGIIAMNGADKVLQNVGVAHYPPTGDFLITSRVGPLLFGQFAASTLIVIERFGWWLHLATVLGFMVYLPYSKHLHIILAFPATWYARLEPNGAMHNMPEVQKEVRILMGLDAADSGGTSLPEFGANDVTGLPRPLVLQAYACTECGRCTAVCPANLTGKKLSPRKIMMDVRDRADAIGRHIDAGNPLVNGACTDGKTLFDTITPEEIHACTTCNACVEACPVLLNPLDILHQLRRYEILTLSAGPAAWLPMFNAIENNGSAWAMASSRDAWTQS
jgi:ferredoxin